MLVQSRQNALLNLQCEPHIFVLAEIPMDRRLVPFAQENAKDCLCGFLVIRTVKSKRGSRKPLVSEFGLFPKYGDWLHCDTGGEQPNSGTATGD